MNFHREEGTIKMLECRPHQSYGSKTWHNLSTCSALPLRNQRTSWQAKCEARQVCLLDLPNCVLVLIHFYILLSIPTLGTEIHSCSCSWSGTKPRPRGNTGKKKKKNILAVIRSQHMQPEIKPSTTARDRGGQAHGRAIPGCPASRN